MVSVEYHTYLCLSLFKVIIIPSTACLQGMLLVLHSYIYKQNEFRNSYFNIIFGTMKTEWNGIKLALGFFYLISFAYDAPEERLLVEGGGGMQSEREKGTELCFGNHKLKFEKLLVLLLLSSPWAAYFTWLPFGWLCLALSLPLFLPLSSLLPPSFSPFLLPWFVD